MNRTPTRRQLLLGAVTLAACRPARDAGGADRSKGNSTAFDAIEARVGGRVGVFAVDTASGRELAHRADERFSMASTFKLLLAGAVLARADRAELDLADRVAFDASALLDHSPITADHVASGGMTIDALAEAAITVSDNAAANLLLARVDGPAGLTRFLRDIGDSVTRLDRLEPALNENAPNDPRDTTSPRSMATLMRKLLVADALSPASRDRLAGWLRRCTTGRERLRAGFPADWSAGDKTGTGARGAVNDVAIAWPPGRAPILVTAYLSDGDAGVARLTAAHAEIGEVVAREL